MKKSNDLAGVGRLIRPLIPWFSALMALVLVMPQLVASEAVQKIEIKSGAFPGLPTSGRGGFLVNSGSKLIAAAESETPDPDGMLSIWTSPVSAGSWTKSAVKVAPWSAAVDWEGKAIVAGGLRAGKPLTEVALLAADGAGGVTVKRLPDLPKPLAGAGAAVIGKTLYVFGGISSKEPAVFEKALWKLDLAAGGNQAVWTEAENFPGVPRAFFAVTQQYGMLCLFGGVGPSTADGARFESLKEAWVYRPQPIEGTSYIGWKRVADLPEPLVGAGAISLGQASVLLVGGERGAASSIPPSMLAADAGGEIPSVYHTVTDAWCAFDNAVPAAGSLPLKMDQSVWLIGRGEMRELTFPRSVRDLAAIDYIVVVGYFALLAGIGFYFSKQESSAEFSLGNRQVKWWAAGISMFATGASAISFMAIPALAFSTNLVWTWPLLTLIPAYFVTAHFIYPLLRRMEITSTYEYLERRFNGPLRLIASAQCIAIQTIGRTAVVLVLPALAISSVTGMNVFLCVLLMGILTTIYTSVGGFESVIWTEVFQGVLKFIAPLAMLIVAVWSLPGGLGEFWKTSQTYGKFDSALFTWDATVPAVWILFISKLLEFTITKAGDQPIIQRVFSAPLHEVRRVSAMEVGCAIVIGVLVNVMGIAIFSYFHANPAKFSPTAQIDQIVPLFVTQAMPVGFAGMVIAAIFASAMATVASAMNSVATIYTEDFYPRIRPDATDAQRLRTLKITSYVVGIIGTCMALLLAGTNPKSLMVVWSQIISLMGGGVVGVYSLGMFTRRVNGFGAVCGALSSIVITLMVKLFTPLHWSTYMPIAIFSCMIMGYLCSLFTPQTRNLDGLTVFTPKKSASET